MKRVAKFAVLIIFLCGWSSTLALGQKPSDDEVQTALSNTYLGEANFLRSLGVPDEVASQYGAKAEVFGSYQWLELRPINGAEARALFLPCSEPGGGAYLYLFTGNAVGWHMADHQSFDCHYDDRVSLQPIGLTSPNQYDFLIHHDCVGRGTGLLDQHTKLTRIEDNRLVVALDQTDLSQAFPAGERKSWVIQSSIFQPTSLRVLEQTRESTHFDKKEQPEILKMRIERREFRWSPTDNKFHVTPWRPLR